MIKRTSSIVLTTDSKYVRMGITGWIKGRKAKGCNNAIKQSVKNKDLWERLTELCETHNIDWRCVQGHSVHVEHERADAPANRVIDELSEGR